MATFKDSLAKMTSSEPALKQQVDRLSTIVETFIHFFQQDRDYHRMVYTFWDAKDILGHVTFWHESFARNVSDLGKGIKPKPLKGKLSEVNSLSVQSTKNATIHDLTQRLSTAQKTIEEFIFDNSITLIPYKKGSRDYSRLEHVEVVANHIHKHLKDLTIHYGTTKK